jgi:hypothetical protein
MARTMLDEYKTSDIFWCEAINTACHAINRLYLHKKLKKTSYELLTGNKPKVSYFRVFGCKCFILNKRPKTSKFAPKVDEGFLLGYGSNEHAYRVFNKTLGRVEVSIDVTFDESNGSQVEQVDLSVVGKEDPPCKAIKQMSIGDIRPLEGQVSEEEDPPAVAAQISADVLNKDVQHTPAGNQQGGSAAPKGGSAAPSTSAADPPASTSQVEGINLEPIFEQEEAEDSEEQTNLDEYPRL